MLNAKNPVVFLAGAIGDHLLAVPALRALVKLFPVKMTLICNPNFKQTFSAEFSQDIRFQPQMYWGGERWTFDIEKVAADLEECDWLVWLNPWRSPEINHALQIYAPEYSVGFYPNFSLKVPSSSKKNTVETVFDIPRYLSNELLLEDCAYAPLFESANREQAHKIRELVPASEKVLAVHADSLPEKMWPAERFVQVLDLFLARHPEFQVFVLGRKDLRLNTGQYGERVKVLNKLALATSLALVGETNLFLGIDSCMLHAADLFRVPGAGLFGPTSPAEWGFRFTNHRHLRAADASMSSIQVEQVLDALEALI